MENPERPGSNESSIGTKTLVERINEVDAMMAQFHSKLELPPGKSNDISIYFSMSRGDLEGLTPDRCAIAVAEIKSYQYFLQKEINRSSARLKWLQAELNRVIGSEAREYNIYSFQEKKLTICNDNSYAAKLVKYITEFEVRLDSVHNIMFALKDMCDAINGIKFTKLNRD